VPSDHDELSALLDVLLDAGVEFILVGGGAAVVHGAPVTTHDVDIVHHRGEDNVDRLLQALESLGARVADPAGRDLRVSRAALRSTGQSLLRTRLGRLARELHLVGEECSTLTRIPTLVRLWYDRREAEDLGLARR
jgi:hypothetical protein